MKIFKVWLTEKRPSKEVKFFDGSKKDTYFNKLVGDSESNLDSYSCDLTEDELSQTTTWVFHYTDNWINFLMGDKQSFDLLLDNQLYDLINEIECSPHTFEIYDESGKKTSFGTMAEPIKRI